MSFREVAPGIERLSVMPFASVNVYLLGDVLVDAGMRGSARKILRALEGRDVRAHVLTHAHPDHQGASHRVCSERGVPLWCGAGDREAAETADMSSQYPASGRWMDWFGSRFWAGPGHPVDRALREGDRVGEFEVLEVPGHTPGHIALWRRRDGALVLGDVALSMNPFLLIPGLREPPRAFTTDVARNRESARKLARLEPELICFGHGRPLPDGARFREFVAGLPG